MHSNRLNPKVCTNVVQAGTDEDGKPVYETCGEPKPADQGMCWECREAAIRKTAIEREFWRFCRVCGEGTHAMQFKPDGRCKACAAKGLAAPRFYDRGSA